MINKKMGQEYNEPEGLVLELVKLSKTNFSNTEEVANACAKVISDNPDVVKSYKAGKGQVIGFLIGQVQKILQGRADPKEVSRILLEKLNEG